MDEIIPGHNSVDDLDSVSIQHMYITGGEESA
jgi:hypothetical protein